MMLISLPESERFSLSIDDPIFMKLIEQISVFDVTVILQLQDLMIVLQFLVLSEEGVHIIIELVFFMFDFLHLNS